MGKKEHAKSKRQLIREQRRRQAQTGRALTIGAIVVVVLLIVFALVWPSLPKDPGEFVTPTLNPRPMANDNAMGDPNAPITITEYSDYQCPYCGKFSTETEPLIVEAYIKPGTVYFVYRSFGNWIGPESLASANAAYCAGEQNKYWEYHDFLFANQTGENVGDFTGVRLAAFAESLGLDMKQFNSCAKSGKYNDRANQDFEDGKVELVGQDQAGTPFFVITYTVNGEVKKNLIPGAYPFEQFQAIIDAAMAEIGQ
jgi:protein-disulfide isomerase